MRVVATLNAAVNMQADEPLARFLDYCTYGHMIDNVVLIVTGTLHERDVHVSALPSSVLLTPMNHFLDGLLLIVAVSVSCTQYGLRLSFCRIHPRAWLGFPTTWQL